MDYNFKLKPKYRAKAVKLKDGNSTFIINPNKVYLAFPSFNHLGKETNFYEIYLPEYCLACNLKYFCIPFPKVMFEPVNNH